MMGLLRLSKYIVILSIAVLLVGCDSSITPEPERLERAHPAPVGSAFTFDEYTLDTAGIITGTPYDKTTFIDSIVSNGTTVGGKNNVTTFRRTIKPDSTYYLTYYYNYEDNGDLSVCYDNALIDSNWTTYPIESHKQTKTTYYDSSVRTGHVMNVVTTIDYDSNVSIVIGDTTFKAHKIRTQKIQVSDFKKGGKFVYITNAYLIIVPSIGYIVEWRMEPYTVNGIYYGNETGFLWILRDYHIQ